MRKLGTRAIGVTARHVMIMATFSTTLLAGDARACALEGDDVMLKRVAVGYTYSGSLQVLSAVSSAQLSGQLERTPGIGAALTPAQRQIVLRQIKRLLSKLSARLADHTAAKLPALSIVLLEPMLWSRIALGNSKPRLSIHVEGPTQGDVVAVTEVPVIAALVNGTLSPRDALSLGLMRLYGSAPHLEAARIIFGASDPRPNSLLPDPKT
jgi:hypothetical protein